jgi:hypothetical protein
MISTLHITGNILSSIRVHVSDRPDMVAVELDLWSYGTHIHISWAYFLTSLFISFFYHVIMTYRTKSVEPDQPIMFNVCVAHYLSAFSISVNAALIVIVPATQAI